MITSKEIGMKFKEKLQKTYETWCTKQPPTSNEPEVKSVHEEISEMLGKFESGLVITCDKEEVNIYTETKSKEEALKFLLELTFSNYFVLVYNFIIKKFPEVEAMYVEKVTEITRQHQSQEDFLAIDDDEDAPLVQPLSLGNLNDSKNLR